MRAEPLISNIQMYANPIIQVTNRDDVSLPVSASGGEWTDHL